MNNHLKSAYTCGYLYFIRNSEFVYKYKLQVFGANMLGRTNVIDGPVKEQMGPINYVWIGSMLNVLFLTTIRFIRFHVHINTKENLHRQGKSALTG